MHEFLAALKSSQSNGIIQALSSLDKVQYDGLELKEYLDHAF